MALPQARWCAARLFRPAGAHIHDLGPKPTLLQATGECSVGAGRPDGQYPAGAQRAMGAFQARYGVQAVIGFAGQPIGTIIDIKQNGVPGGALSPDGFGNVFLRQAYPRIVQRPSRKMPDVFSIPLDDRRDELRHGDVGIGLRLFERGREGVAHTQTTDEDPPPCASFKAIAGESGEQRFGNVQTAVHQLFSRGADRKFGPALQQRDIFRVSGNPGPGDLYQGDQASLLLFRYRGIFCL
jgi:hypothetical protein